MSADDHTTVIPPIRDFPAPDNRTTAGLRRPAPGEDPANAHRTTDGLRRPGPNTGSGPYPVVPDSRATSSGAHPVVPDGRATSSGAYPVLPEGRATSSGAHPVVPEGRAAASGTYPVVPDSRGPVSGSFPAVRAEDSSPNSFRAFADATDDDSATGSGGSPAATSRATSTGTSRPVSRATSTGTNRPVSRTTSTGSTRAVSTGGFRISESRATATGTNRPVSKATSTGTHRPATKTEGRSTATGGQRTATDGRSTVTGTHRAMGKVPGRKRIAKWPIFAGAFVVLLAIGLVAWGWANNVVNSRAEAQANACTDGNSTLTVVVTPTVQKPVSTAADRWNQANTVVHAHCVHVDVRAIPSQQVLDALTGKTDVATIGGFPAAWVPENSFWVNQLVTAKPGIVGSPAESVASARSADYPFLGLAGGTVDEVQNRAAQVFRDYLRDPQQQADFAAAGLTGG
ncbi:substrate-binding domain-containing protein [Amycolatopsis sp. GM8]|uniref:substrate-binding domain-containing protein n=1 Tax=Amycolatopsis sp. GM8 TaxID=2896530 RepID=UPI001F4442B3|nr:substrate-binding domain-containing protein [Amycolatopsis sp. GM8]